MRSLLSFILIGFAIVGSSSVLPNLTTVQGQFLGKGFGLGNQKLQYGLMSVKLKQGEATLATNYVQADGKFILLKKLSGPADLYYSALGLTDDVYVAAISASQLDTIRLVINLPINYPQKHGRAICPKCKRVDRVLDIVYGDGSAIVVSSITPQGDTVYLPYNKKHYYAGTCLFSDLDPKWCCLRDAIKF